ncbi:MAG TPA: hypothetical protein VFS55_07650 [Dokdonella sp.]|nr:hypothetical protein [Dokdonella sp.]
MNAKMKVLSIALVGLCGFAGSAMAACPAGPTTADGGAWTSATQLPDATSSPLAIATPGLDGTECKLTAALAPNDTASAAFVRYNHAASEPSYRAHFIVDTTALTNFADSTTSVVVFQAPASAVNEGFNRLLRVAIVAGPSGAKRVRFIAQRGGLVPIGQTFGTNLVNGINHIEVNLQVGAGAAGDLKYWVNTTPGTTEPAASGELPNLNNAGWGGVSAAQLGLTAPTAPYSSAHGGELVGFDRFDSRRQTYIGY